MSSSTRDRTLAIFEKYLFEPVDAAKIASAERLLLDKLKLPRSEYRLAIYFGSPESFLVLAIHAITKSFARKFSRLPKLIIHDDEPLSLWDAARWHETHLGAKVLPYEGPQQLTTVDNIALLAMSDENISLSEVSNTCLGRGICHLLNATKIFEIGKHPLPGHISVVDLHAAIGFIPGMCLTIINKQVEEGFEMMPGWSGDPAFLTNQAFLSVIKPLTDWSPDLTEATTKFTQFCKALKETGLRLVTFTTFNKDTKAYPDGIIIYSPIPAPYLNFTLRRKGNSVFRLDSAENGISRGVREDIFRINFLKPLPPIEKIISSLPLPSRS